MLACGIDVGSSQTKCVIMDGNRILQGRGLVRSGANLARAARHALREALKEAKIEEYDLTFVVSTGYGAQAITLSQKTAAETLCHARGAIFRYPDTRTILDIGGLDMNAIRTDSTGNVLDFAMNDKCSAGTGHFLEHLADLLNLSISELGNIRPSDDDELLVTNVCSIFAEQEIMNYLEQGREVNEVVGGVFLALARRAAGLIRRVGLLEEVTLTGGVSNLPGVVKALEHILGVNVNAGIDGVFIGALGAALLGLDKAAGRSSNNGR